MKKTREHKLMEEAFKEATIILTSLKYSRYFNEYRPILQEMTTQLFQAKIKEGK